MATMAAEAVENVAEPGGLEGRKDGDGGARTEKERKWYVFFFSFMIARDANRSFLYWGSEERLTFARSWWPTWQEFRTHYIKEIGFLASAVQLLGASIFWISGFTALPPIYDALSVPVMNGVYWVPQVVGGTGFIVSGLMFMVEVQDKWCVSTPLRPLLLFSTNPVQCTPSTCRSDRLTDPKGTSQPPRCSGGRSGSGT